MKTQVVVLLIVLAVLAAALIAFLSWPDRKKPCYRCGGVASTKYMALDYCEICRTVIIRMMPLVGLGGMPGFPGASGYTEFPQKQTKGEIDG